MADLEAPEAAVSPLQDPPVRKQGAGAFVWPAQLAIMVVAALAALVFHATLPGKLPSDEDYQAVAQVLTKEARPDDAVLLFPWWAERARVFLPETPLVVGYLGSEKDALWRHPRIWVLGQPELPKADLRAFEEAFLPGRKPLGEERRFGPVTLRLYENGRARTAAFVASEALSFARVYLEDSAGQRTPCALSGDRFRCPGGPQLYVRTEWHEVFYEPRRCLYLAAPGGDTKLVVEFPDVPLSGDGMLEAGYIWEHAVKKDGFTTTYVALEDPSTGARLSDVALAPGTEGFRRASVIEKRPQPSALRLTVQSQRAASRFVCVDLSIFGGGA